MRKTTEAQRVKTTSSKPFEEITEPHVKSSFHGILVLEGTSKVLWSIFLASAVSTRREAGQYPLEYPKTQGKNA